MAGCGHGDPQLCGCPAPPAGQDCQANIILFKTKTCQESFALDEATTKVGLDGTTPLLLVSPVGFSAALLAGLGVSG